MSLCVNFVLLCIVLLKNLGKHFWSLYVLSELCQNVFFIWILTNIADESFGTFNSLWHLWLILFTAHICLVPLCLWQFFFCLSCFHLLYVVFCSSQREEILAVFWFSAVQSLLYFPYCNITTLQHYNIQHFFVKCFFTTDRSGRSGGEDLPL